MTGIQARLLSLRVLRPTNYHRHLALHQSTCKFSTTKMSVGGTFQHVKNENFVEYLTALGVPEDKAKLADSFKPKLQVVVDGKKVSVNSDSGVENSSSTFTLGEEVDEPLPNNITLKSTAKIDGSTLTVTSKSPKGKSGSRVFKFSDSELTLSEDGGSVVAKRFYKRV
ncbi:fatty acid-binding protein 9-like isoform X2 [Zophobas morio]|uniref:fatty acid-binding protein 9-like isoform X2 n=1 Tax=Zophobas morio TaxID=2755281 RepID=UPI0030828C4C